MDDLRARISFQRDIRDCNILCLTETWLTPLALDTAVTPSDNFSVLRMDRTAEVGKTKGGGVCFMINKTWCDPRNISILSRSCSPHLEHLSIICHPFYLPREFSSIMATAFYVPPQADTSLALSKLHDVLSEYINKHPDSASIVAGDFNKANLRKVMPNFHQHVSCPTRGPNTLDHCYTPFKNPTKLIHCRLLANRTTTPFSSHRNINKGSFRNPRGREKWRAGPPTLKLCYRRLLVMSTGTCSGRVHLTSANSRM